MLQQSTVLWHCIVFVVRATRQPQVHRHSTPFKPPPSGLCGDKCRRGGRFDNRRLRCSERPAAPLRDALNMLCRARIMDADFDMVEVASTHIAGIDDYWGAPPQPTLPTNNYNICGPI